MYWTERKRLHEERTIRKLVALVGGGGGRGGGGGGVGEVQNKYSCKGKLDEKKVMHAN